MAERPLQVGDRVRHIDAPHPEGEVIEVLGARVLVHTGGGYAEHWESENCTTAILATLDDGVEVRRGRDVPAGWEWRYGDNSPWHSQSRPQGMSRNALLECRPKPPELVTIELSVEDAEALVQTWNKDIANCVEVRLAQAARDALERRGHTDG